MGERFRLLGAGRHGSDERQQTLAAVVDWSYDLLFEDERRLFERVSVFVGGWTLDAAERVCASPDLPEGDIADLLGRLVDKSLVVLDRTGASPRYRLLQTLADYARDRLAERGETRAVRDRHLAWVADMADAAEPGTRGAEQLGWFARLASELPNIEAALQWATAMRKPDLGCRIIAGIAWFAYLSGLHEPVYRHALAVLALPDHAGPDRPVALAWASRLGAAQPGTERLGDEAIDEAMRLGDHRVIGIVAALRAFALVSINADLDRAAQLLALSRDHYEQIGERWGLAQFAMLDGLIALARKEPGRATVCFTRARDLFGELGDGILVGISEIRLGETAEWLGDLATAEAAARAHLERLERGGSARQSGMFYGKSAWLACVRGDLDRAVELAGRALAGWQDRSSPMLVAWTAFVFGVAASAAGDLDEATMQLTRARDLHRMVGTAREIAIDESHLGLVAEAAGRMDEAVAHHGEAIRNAAVAGDPWTIVRVWEACASTHAARGEGDEAAELVGAAAAIRDTANLVPTVGEATVLADARRRALELIGEPAFAAAAARGATRGGERARDRARR
jgi:tetratricopeptide (TPR) repeat protein/predicted transcriptional regulator